MVFVVVVFKCLALGCSAPADEVSLSAEEVCFLCLYVGHWWYVTMAARNFPSHQLSVRSGSQAGTQGITVLDAISLILREIDHGQILILEFLLLMST